MGYFRHHVIVVSDVLGGDIDAAHAHACVVFGDSHARIVTPVMVAPVNNLHTFACMPDGSKEGWAESNGGDEARDMLIDWLASTPLDWVEVVIYDDDAAPRVERRRWNGGD